jgi:hypothetical protein
MATRLLPLLMLACLGAQGGLSARAEPAPKTQAPPKDVIGRLLEGRPARDEDEPDTAGKARADQDVETSVLPAPSAASPGKPGQTTTYSSIPYAPGPRTQRDAPVYVEETGKTPDAAPALRDMAYDSRIRASFAAAEGFQGPLDGGWTLATADGQGLYALQLVDRRDRLEGVWRDLRRKGAIDASGVLDDVARQGPDLTLRFAARSGGPASVANLHGAADGGWSGEFSEGGQKRPVTLRRTAP